MSEYHNTIVADHIIRLLRGTVTTLEAAEESAIEVEHSSQLIVHDLLRRARLALDLVTDEESTRRNKEAVNE